MKIRTGFVSNSSSSSFIIYKQHLTEEQTQLIECHRDVAGEDAWVVEDNDTFLSFSTWMDNFSMVDYLMSIGVSSSLIKNMEYY